MKGVIFNILEEMVIEHKGMETWNNILEQVSTTDGIYTAADSYPDEQLFDLVEEVSKQISLPMEDVIGSFGEFMFNKLASRHPIFIEQSPDLKTFLKSIESVIHVEVRKLYDQPNLPTFEYEEPNSDVLIMQYSSPRKLCVLAEGLIRGAALHYKTNIEVGHTTCMHKGAKACDLNIRFL